MALKDRKLLPLPLLDEEQLLRDFRELGIKENHAFSIWRHVIHNGVSDIDDIPDLPKAVYKLVKSKYVLTTSTVVSTNNSSDGSTTKLLIRLQDGHMIESVIMRYGTVHLSSFPENLRNEEGFRSKQRATLCVSSQIGCSMGCTFCATGTMGLLGNLWAGEILEQLYHANKVEPIRNVVFMGMGEPLDNYDCVINAIRAMSDVRRFSLSFARISVSTVGVVPRLRTLAKDAPGISLALSLHAPTQELRTQIVPSAKAWSVEKIMQAVDDFIDTQSHLQAARRCKVLVEYVLIANVNDSDQTAHDLGKLLEPRSCLLNVIPYNPTTVTRQYQPPTSDRTHAFCEIVRSYQVMTIIRQELGQDIAGACGQLVVKTLNLGDSGASSCNGDIEDMGAGSRPTPPTQGVRKFVVDSAAGSGIGETAPGPARAAPCPAVTPCSDGGCNGSASSTPSPAGPVAVAWSTFATMAIVLLGPLVFAVAPK